MISQRALTTACCGAIVGSLLLVLSPASLRYALPWNHPPSAAEHAPSQAQFLPRLTAVSGDASNNERPTRLVSLWRSGESGGVTVLDPKGAAHTLKIGDEIGGYRLRNAGGGKAVFDSSTGDLVLALNPLPVAPDLAAIGVKNPTNAD